MTIKPLLAAFMLWLVPAAHAAVLPDVGQIERGHIELFGKPMLLPPGEWRVAATGFDQVVGENPGPYGTIGTVMLTAMGKHAVPAFVLVRTNAVPVRDGWGPPMECVEQTALLRSLAEPRDLHDGCAFVIAARAGRIAAWSGDPAIARLLPPWALVAGFRVSDRNDVVEARYGIVTELPPSTAWFGDGQALQPSQTALLQHLGDWAREARQASIAALRDPPDQMSPIPALALANEATAAAPGEDITALRLGLYKLATYRGPVTAWNWALASTLSGNIWIGASVAAWQSITHSAIYFGNEMAWEWPDNVPAMGFVPTPPAAATSASEPVDRIPAGFALNGKQVPMPAGTWTVLAEQTGSSASAAVLGQLDGHTLRGIAVVHANPSKTTDIFGTASDCSRRDVYFATIRYDTPVDGYCAYAKPVTPGDAASNDALWTQAQEHLAHAGVSVPPVLLAVGARARTRENFIDVRYYFPPDAAIAGATLDAGHVADTPAMVEHVVALQAWADLAQLPLELGVRGRLPASQGELPWPWQMADVHDALTHQAHAPLERLRAVGAIDDAELRRQLALADAALAERERQRWSLWLRSAYKVATYRVLSYFDAIAVSWIITTSPEQSLAYATINAVAQPIMAYVNEIGWAGSGVGRAAAPLQPVDFPEIGSDHL